jgi:hypothetical protein
MPTTVKASVAMFVVVFGLACGDQSVSAPDANRLASMTASASRVDDVQEQAVTGGAGFVVASEGNLFEAYSVSAIRHTDGRVTGELEIKSNIGGGFRIHGEVACFTILGNTARLAARVTQSTNPNVAPDSYLFWSLTDNGEGKKSAPDMTSDFLLADEALAQSHCRIGENISAKYVVREGNLQVH